MHVIFIKLRYPSTCICWAIGKMNRFAYYFMGM